MEDLITIHADEGQNEKVGFLFERRKYSVK